MSLKYLPLAIILCTMGACNQNSELKEVRKVQKAAKEAPVETGAFIHAPTVEVEGPVAVYFHPDSAKLTRMEERMGDKFFNEAEENMYLISSSRDFLLKRKVKVLETEARELRFRKNDGSTKIVDLTSSKYSWGLFLFNGKSDPVQLDMRKPEKQFEAYMQK